MNAEEQAKKLRSWMPYIVVALLCLFFGRLFVGIFTGESSKPGVVWQPFTEAAYQTAVGQKKPIMIYFAADWCGPCHKLRLETFTDPDVIAGAERFVRFKVDLTSPQGEMAKAGEKYAVSALPTVVFIGADGNERVRIRLMGFEEAARFRQRMQAVP
jgi:thiol:disulfide interchange protein DsbD